MIISLIFALVLTIIIEISMSFIMGIREREDLEVIFWINVLTNPIVVYIANCVKLLNNIVIYNSVVIILEILVIVVEFALLRKFINYKKKSPLLIVCVNNIVSYSLGCIISWIIF